MLGNTENHVQQPSCFGESALYDGQIEVAFSGLGFEIFFDLVFSRVWNIPQEAHPPCLEVTVILSWTCCNKTNHNQKPKKVELIQAKQKNQRLNYVKKHFFSHILQIF